MEIEPAPLLFGYLKHASVEDVERRKTLIASRARATNHELDEIYVEPNPASRIKFNELLGALKLHQSSGRKLVVAVTGPQDLGTTRYEQKWATDAIEDHGAVLEKVRFASTPVA